MIPVRTLTTSPERTQLIAGDQSVPLLSVVLLCHWPYDELTSRMLIARFGHHCPDIVEVVIVIEPPSCPTDSLKTFTSWCTEQGCQVVKPDSPCGLSAIRLNEGILASKGQWIWLLDLKFQVPSPDLGSILATLGNLPPDSILVLVHPDDERSLYRIPGVKDIPWLDMLFKGWELPLENMFFPRRLFYMYGLLDPHIVMAPYFRQEFLHRVCRFVRFEEIRDRGAVIGIRSGHFPPIFYYWLDTDRKASLTPANFLDYEVDNLRQFDGRIPAKELWQAYLDHILPYYYLFRHQLPESFLDRPQSLPPRERHVLCVKGNDYETLVDLGFRNFDVYAQGRRFLKSSYIHAGQVETEAVASNDAVLLIRTTDEASLSLARCGTSNGMPIGYALDDDLLNFFKYGRAFEAFRPGHWAYDTMVDTIRLADVVLCSSPHIKRSVHSHNQRTIHYEGSVHPQYLPEVGSSKNRELFKFGYAGGGYRARELRMIWPAIERICQEYGDRVRFELWGIDANDLPSGLEQVSTVPFSINYYEYLTRLKSAGFNAMLVPLLRNPLPNQAKAPNKVYETAVAGAVGLYSDVPSYQVVKTYKLGLMVDEDPEAWYQAMRCILEMSEEKYTEMQQRALAFVREFYTTPAMLPVHEAGLEAMFFHASTRHARGSDGRPRVMYVFPDISGKGGGEILFRRRIELAMEASISPLVVVPTSLVGSPEWEMFRRSFLEANGIDYDFAVFRVFPVTPPARDVLPVPEEEVSVRDLLTRHPVALVHTGGYAPAFGRLCREMGIPHIVSDYIVADDYQWPDGHLPFKHCDLVQSDSIYYAQKWSQLFGSDWFCARDVVPGFLFEIGFERLYGQSHPPAPDQPIRLGIVGTVMPRKSQLEAIQAVSLLVQRGYNIQLYIFGEIAAHADYYALCCKAVHESKIDERVVFKGHLLNIGEIYTNIDILLSVSTFESFPNTIKEATAAGILVVASSIGGIPELMKDGINCILTQTCTPEQIADAVVRAITLPPEENLRIRRRAYTLARQMFHPRRGMLDLLTMYNLTLEIHAASRAGYVQHGAVAFNQHHTTSSSWLVTTVTEPPKGELAEAWAVLRPSRNFRLLPPADGLVGLEFMIGTIGFPRQGKIKWELLHNGQVLREGAVDLSQVAEHSWVSIKFDKLTHSKGQPLTFRATIQNFSGRIPTVSIYEYISGGPWVKSNVFRRGRRWITKRFFSSRRLVCRYFFEK